MERSGLGVISTEAITKAMGSDEGRHSKGSQSMSPRGYLVAH